jgi:hypothetical protein
MSEGVPEGPESVYAREGTAAHALAEITARRVILESLTPQQYAKAIAAWRKEYDISDEAHGEMAEHADAYVAYLQFRLDANPGSQLLLEQRLPSGVPDCWGTSDAVIVSPTCVESVDFKYGLGVRVEAVGNPQLRLYGVGALEAFGDLLGEVERVRLTIFQPRLSHVATEELPAAELRAWRDSIIPIAESALGPDAPFGPSEEACRWCPVSGRCTAQLQWSVTRDFGTDFEKDRKEYDRRHDMVRNTRGPAKLHPCHDCGGEAKDWSQIHGTDGEHPDHYAPRCRSCHSKYDNVAREFTQKGRPATEAEKDRIKKVNSRKYGCGDCALVSNLGGLITHQKATGHEGQRGGPEIMDEVSLAEALDRIPMIEAWCKAVRDYCLDRVYSQGQPIPGYKVVLSGGRRVITDPEAALEALTAIGYALDEVSVRKPKGIGELEKLLKKDFSIAVGPFVQKSEGSPSLVPESDARLAIDPEGQAAVDFSREVEA